MNEPFAELLTPFQKFTYKLDMGMHIDIEACLEGNDSIASFAVKLNVEQALYEVEVVLKEFSKRAVLQLFRRFVNFIEYSGGITCYKSSLSDDHAYFSLYTISHSGLSAHCEIHYSGLVAR